MKTYLITGGAGFIGSNIAGRLLRDGQKVRILDNFSSGRHENLADLDGNLDVIEGDIRDMPAIKKAVEGADYVLHQAALPSVQRSVEDPATSNEVNITGTLNVLIAARDAGVKRVVYAASSSAYGDTPTLPKREDMMPTPLSPYAINKLTGEYYCSVFHSLYGLETVALRYFNIFGPKQDPTSHYSAVIPIFTRRFLEGKAPTVNGDGEQSRDFTYVDNAVSANLLACTAPDAPGKVFNIGCGDRFTLNQLLDRLRKIMGHSLPAEYGPARQGDVKDSLADISQAEKYLGYRVLVDFDEGLRKTVEWFSRP